MNVVVELSGDAIDGANGDPFPIPDIFVGLVVLRSSTCEGRARKLEIPVVFGFRALLPGYQIEGLLMVDDVIAPRLRPIPICARSYISSSDSDLQTQLFPSLSLTMSSIYQRRGYIRASGFGLYPYMFVVSPSKHACSRRTRRRRNFCQAVREIGVLTFRSLGRVGLLLLPSSNENIPCMVKLHELLRNPAGGRL